MTKQKISSFTIKAVEFAVSSKDKVYYVLKVFSNLNDSMIHKKEIRDSYGIVV